MHTFDLVFILILILGSAFLSSSEIALFSLSRFQVRSYKDQAPETHSQLRKMLSDPSGILLTVLILNECINVSLSSIVTGYVRRLEFSHFVPSIPSWIIEIAISAVITTPIVLLFCEITPKTIGARANHVVAHLATGPLFRIYKIFAPIRTLFRKITQAILPHPKKNEPDPSDHKLKESEFLSVLEEGHRQGVIQETEFELIQGVFELDNTPVEDILTPIQSVFTLPMTTTIKSALLYFAHHRYSRIPVTGANKKEIVGILYTKDLLRMKLDSEHQKDTIEPLVRKTLYVHPTTKLNTLFRKFKQNKIHMAIVQNNSKDSIGIVTLSDVMEELFSDLLSKDRSEEELSG